MPTNPPPPDDDDIDDDTLAAFAKVLSKHHERNPQWLTKLFPHFSQSGSDQKGAGDLTTFLQSLLSKEETKAASLSDRLEAAMSLMTPEQLTQLRSATPKPGNDPKGSGAGGAKPDALPIPPADPIPAKPKRKWL